MWKFFSLFVPAITTTLTGLATWGLSILKKKVDNEDLKNAISELDNIIKINVDNVSQTLVKEMKKSGEKLSDEQKATIKRIAINGVKKTASEALLKTVTASIGNLDSYIASKIESNVLEAKSK